MSNQDAALAREIEALHAFFVHWFSGSVPLDDALFQREFHQRFDEHSTMIPPSGALTRVADLGELIRDAHGSNPDFRIQIRNVRVQRRWPDHALVTYEEWQRNALASTPPDNGRVASALFRIEGERLTWLHVHETWLPEELVLEDAFDF